MLLKGKSDLPHTKNGLKKPIFYGKMKKWQNFTRKNDKMKI